MISKGKKIFVAGHNGLVGSAVLRKLKSDGFENILTVDRKFLDLTNKNKVNDYFIKNKPDIVIMCAAKVGGINANNSFPFDFISTNLNIQNNIIESAHLNDVDSLVFLGSSCIYPKYAAQPIKETELLNGDLEFTNRSYAIAKIEGIELCWSLNRQFNRKYFSIMPTNLYGFNDNFDTESSHVIPGLITKFYNAILKNSSSVTLWGSGTPLREFMHADDLASAIMFLLNNKNKLDFLLDSNKTPLINVGFGSDISIKNLAFLIADILNYKGEIRFDNSMPDGTPKKLIDSSIINQLGWKPKISLKEGLAAVISDFIKK